ncbi:WYL domain-containing protein [Vibrio chagasii]|uniref:WYL domain-containing protein n=1 Tax=Vibrio chagasii TaxID=170679 RepID=A0A7Y3YRY8_9VIBR|nr:WYL domain-containing protein [Vibrio chagasii]NOH35641.1 hypothetical protein [Vibrio chagasii]
MSFWFHWAMISLPFPLVLVAMRKYLKEEIPEEDAPSSVEMGWMVAHVAGLIICLFFGGWAIYISIVAVVAVGYLILVGIAKLLGVEDSKIHTKVTESDNSVLNEIELHKEYAMTYRDSKGNVSERRIVLHGVEHKNGEEYLQAVCLLRNSSRTFKASNVVSLLDTETGEILI